MSKAYDELSRRNLLRYLGNSILMLPVLRAFNDTQVFGADAAPKRAVFFFFPSGIIDGKFHPASAGPLGSLPEMTSPLERVKSDIIILRDSTYNTGNSHQGGMNYSLTGLGDSKPGISIDELIGQKNKGVFPVQRYGICSNFEGGAAPQSCSFDLPNHVAAREDNPAKAFLTLFGGAAPTPQPTSGGTVMTPAAATKGLSNKSKKSLLDDNLEQLTSLQKKLGSIEKYKVDSHLDSVRELERRVDALITDSTAPGGTPSGGGGAGGPSGQCTKKIDQKVAFDPNDGSYDAPYKKVGNYDVVADMMNDIAIQALACRMTNCLLIMHGHSVFEIGFAAGRPGAGGKGHHSMGHYTAEGTPAGHIANQQYMMGKLANLIEGLGKCAEGDKSVLYNSVVMGFSELGDSNLHSMKNVPIVLAGQAGGYFKTGRCVSGGGAFHNKTLVSIAQAIGMTDNSIGDASVTGPMPGLTG